MPYYEEIAIQQSDILWSIVIKSPFKQTIFIFKSTIVFCVAFYNISSQCLKFFSSSVCLFIFLLDSPVIITFFLYILFTKSLFLVLRFFCSFFHFHFFALCPIFFWTHHTVVVRKILIMFILKKSEDHYIF